MIAEAQRRRARPTQVLPEHFAKTAILAGATKVFMRHGILAVRVEDILVEAKIARRTFYKYFASKEEVLAALHELWTEKLLSAIEAAQSERADDPLAGIRAAIDIFLGFYLSGPKLLRELVEIAMRSDSLLQERRQWLRSEIVKRVDEAIFAIDGRRLDPLVYYGLFSAIEGILLELSTNEASARDIERAKRVTHALVDQALGLPNGRDLPLK